MKDATIAIRVEHKVKDQLMKLAKEHRRELPDLLRLILTDIANKKIKLDL
jgi:antitoxin component of RelBE/YafQ-DinJ toxin-antitoxin module